jgi:cytochrome c553
LVSQISPLACRYAAPLLAAYLAFMALTVSAQIATPAQERFAACLACHGEGGRSTQPLIPSLAGQPSFYAITQLFLFREGRRNNAAMTAMAKGMTDDDMRAFSELIGKLPPALPLTATSVDVARIQRGAVLAQQHRCSSCHGADFAGDKQVARLAHQREDYLIQTLTEFRAGKRIGYTSAMNEALAGLPPQALADLAYYLANLPKPTP